MVSFNALFIVFSQCCYLTTASPHAILPPSNTTTPLTTSSNASTDAPTILATKPPIDPNVPDPNYSTNYPGPIHRKEMDYYLRQYSPDWWRLNLDMITATACLCSSPTDGFKSAQIASYMQYDYYSHFHRRPYSLNHMCGPTLAVATDNHCWSFATGSDYHGAKPDSEETYCYFNDEDGQRLCVNWGVKGRRWMTWHGHKRMFDREHTHKWEAEMGHVRDRCDWHCGDKFGMVLDEGGDHDPSFITTYFPPKPIPWN